MSDHRRTATTYLLLFTLQIIAFRCHTFFFFFSHFFVLFFWYHTVIYIYIYFYIFLYILLFAIEPIRHRMWLASIHNLSISADRCSYRGSSSTWNVNSVTKRSSRIKWTSLTRGWGRGEGGGTGGRRIKEKRKREKGVVLCFSVAWFSRILDTCHASSLHLSDS